MRKATRIALINSGIAAGLVFLGAFSTGHITTQAVIAAIAAGGTTFLTKMKEYLKRIESKKAQVRPGILTFYGA